MLSPINLSKILTVKAQLLAISAHAYNINKNYKYQGNHANFALAFCIKTNLQHKERRPNTCFYDFLKVSEIAKSYNRFLYCTKLIQKKNIKLFFATDNIEYPGDTACSISNAAELTNHCYFNENYWTPGNITNGWWFENVNYNLKSENYISSMIFLPNLETTFNYWKETQIMVTPLASLGPLNTNIKQKINYFLLGSYLSVRQTYFFSRFTAALIVNR